MAYKGLHLVKVANQTYRIMNGNHERVGVITYNKDWKLRPGTFAYHARGVKEYPIYLDRTADAGSPKRALEAFVDSPCISTDPLNTVSNNL